ncbi:MAG: signal peptide peptidase SppA [Tissierellia bacterium]|nr:signal peptide peptidase SppA [Tissierellia bacterium]
MKESKKYSDQKRWIAVGIAVILFVMSGISGSIQKNLLTSMSEDKSKNLLSDFFNPHELTENVISGTDKKNRILVIPIHGVIAQGDSSIIGGSSYDHGMVLDTLHQVADDPTIKGILLDVDSPGGGVYESAQLYKAITEIQEEFHIPIYSLMGSVAASGGYYISAPADKIYASPETTTGSIGVIMDGMNLTGLYEKLGIQSQVYKSGPNKDMGSSSRPATEEEKEIFQNYIDSAYQRFVTVVEKGRGMDRQKVLQLADGRIYDGEQAVENGLVDELGYYEEAIAGLSKEIGVDDPEIFMMESFNMNPFTNILLSKLQVGKDPVSRLVNALDLYHENSSPRAMYILGGDLYE